MNDVSRPKPNWKVIKEFEENGILVEVSASDGYRPRYTVRVGRRGERGTIPFLQLFVEGQGKVRVRPVADIVARLLDEAEKHVEDLAQQWENEYLEQRIAREDRQVQKEGKKRKSSGYKGHGK
jgi:hypothetical protein